MCASCYSVVDRLCDNMFPSLNREIEAPQAPELKDPFTAIVSGAFKQSHHAENKAAVFSGSLLISKSSDSSQQWMQPLLVFLQTTLCSFV